MANGDWFGRFYGHGYRGALLTALALLGDAEAAAHVTRESFAIAHRRRLRIAGSADPEGQVRALVVRLARRRLRWRALAGRVRRGSATAPSERATVLALHDPAGLPPDTIASIMDIPVSAVESYLAGAGPVSWASVRQPVVTRVLDRARLRATRRRMLAGAAVAVLAVGAVVPLLRVEPPAASPAPATTPPPPAPEPTPNSAIYDIAFADERHGHALRADCGQFECDLDLMSTVDGERWTAHEVARVGKPPGSAGRLFVLGPGEVAVDWFPVDDPHRVGRVYSPDGGRTWTPVPVAARGTVREIPPGAVLEPTCVPRGTPTCELNVVLPGSGRSARLASSPRLYRPFSGSVPIAGGRWWVAGQDPRTRAWVLAVSEDDGRTWTVSHLSWRGKADGPGWTVVAAGESLIATATGPLAPSTYGPMAFFRSDDRGRSWTRTSGAVPAGLAGIPVAASDGTLLVNTEDGRGLRSRDDGRTFTEVRPRFRGYAYWARCAYVAVSGQGSPVQYSTDGLHWRDLRLEP